MNDTLLENVNVTSFDSMPTPAELHERLPLSQRAREIVLRGRAALRNILDRKDPRLFVIVGPCSIHDPVAGLEKTRKMKAPQEKGAETLLPLKHVYFDKTRPTTGRER